jgi:hypothetical protein
MVSVTVFFWGVAFKCHFQIGFLVRKQGVLLMYFLGSRNPWVLYKTQWIIIIFAVFWQITFFLCVLLHQKNIDKHFVFPIHLDLDGEFVQEVNPSIIAEHDSLWIPLYLLDKHPNVWLIYVDICVCPKKVHPASSSPRQFIKTLISSHFLGKKNLRVTGNPIHYLFVG